MLVSIVIRTLNEDLYLSELLSMIDDQISEDFSIESVIIDSGSSDNTIEIAKAHNAKITYIDKKDFTFGRSLNMGSEFADGDILVYISGHCVPTSNYWLKNLVEPILKNTAVYTYGRQIGRDTTKFSEYKIFQKYFPSSSKIPQNDFFCNNANSAIKRSIWQKYRFNEELTGLEDMELSKRAFQDGEKIAYISDACVYHIHNEIFTQTRRRYERESIALQKIMPEVQITIIDMARYLIASIFSDFKSAFEEKCFFNECLGIIKFRFAQYSGTYRGNHEHRTLSKRRKENYFYPTNITKK
jgi:glycosyltransferase involved in cell wall biosynthesis